MELHERIDCKMQKFLKQYKSSHRQQKVKKLSTSPNRKTQQKQKQISKSSLLASIKLKKRTSIKPEQEEEEIYASLLEEDEEIDHQICFGPWVRIKEDLKNSLKLRKQEPIKANINIAVKTSCDKKPIQTITHKIDKTLPRFRSSSVLETQKCSPFQTIKKQKYSFEKKVLIVKQKSTPKIDYSKIQARYLQGTSPQKLTNRQKSSITLGTLNTCKTQKNEASTRINLGRYIQNIKTLQAPTAFQTRVRVTPKLYQSIRERRGSIPQLKQNIFTQTRNHLYDFKNLVPERTHVKRTLQPITPLTKPLLPKPSDATASQFHSLSSSCLRQPPNPPYQRPSKFDKLLFMDKYRFPRPVV